MQKIFVFLCLLGIALAMPVAEEQVKKEVPPVLPLEKTAEKVPEQPAADLKSTVSGDTAQSPVEEVRAIDPSAEKKKEELPELKKDEKLVEQKKTPALPEKPQQKLAEKKEEATDPKPDDKKPALSKDEKDLKSEASEKQEVHLHTEEKKPILVPAEPPSEKKVISEIQEPAESAPVPAEHALPAAISSETVPELVDSHKIDEPILSHQKKAGPIEEVATKDAGAGLTAEIPDRVVRGTEEVPVAKPGTSLGGSAPVPAATVESKSAAINEPAAVHPNVDQKLTGEIAPQTTLVSETKSAVENTAQGVQLEERNLGKGVEETQLGKGEGGKLLGKAEAPAKPESAIVEQIKPEQKIAKTDESVPELTTVSIQEKGAQENIQSRSKQPALSAEVPAPAPTQVPENTVAVRSSEPTKAEQLPKPQEIKDQKIEQARVNEPVLPTEPLKHTEPVAILKPEKIETAPELPPPGLKESEKKDILLKKEVEDKSSERKDDKKNSSEEKNQLKDKESSEEKDESSDESKSEEKKIEKLSRPDKKDEERSSSVNKST